MTYTPKRLIEGQLLTAAAATYYTAPTATSGATPPPAFNTKTILTRVTFTNVDTIPHLVTLYLVPSGGAISNATIFYENVPAQATLESKAQGHILEPGDFLQALADLANQVNIVASGVEVT